MRRSNVFLHNRPAGGDTTKESGDAGEDAALRHLVAQGLRLIVRNYRTPGRGGGEIDLIMQDVDGTTVFVEVRKRAQRRMPASGAAGGALGVAASSPALTHRTQSLYGGAAASVSTTKQARIIFAAKHYLMRLSTWPPCRFDVVALDGDTLTWIKGAFNAE
jgi:putative endonuclease